MYDEKDLKKKVNRQLNGANNKRLLSTVKINDNYTAAWADRAKIYINTNVTAPSDDQTDEAKDWVDNGSKL